MTGSISWKLSVGITVGARGSRPAATGAARAELGARPALPLLIAAGFADWLFHLDAVIRAVLLAA